jgi:hypothetical protein
VDCGTLGQVMEADAVGSGGLRSKVANVRDVARGEEGFKSSAFRR